MMVSKLCVMDFARPPGRVIRPCGNSSMPHWMGKVPRTRDNRSNHQQSSGRLPMSKFHGCLVAAVALAAALVGIPHARADYPEKQITMMVCFPAGGGTDIAARLINTQLGEALGKPVIVENRGGAGGNIAIQAMKRLPADGYSLLVCSSAFVVNPSLYANAAYDPLKDFVPLMVLGASPNVFVVPEKSPIRSMKEFIEKAKASGGTMNWTSSGVGT